MHKKLWRARQQNVLNPSNVYIKKRQIGTALYTHVSRFNHSCDPNVAFVFDNQSRRIVLCSTRFIRKGEELTISYGPVYHINKVLISIIECCTFTFFIYQIYCRNEICFTNLFRILIFLLIDFDIDLIQIFLIYK